MASKEQLTGINRIQSYDTGKPYLDRLINPSFQGVNRFSVLSFENNTNIISHTGWYFTIVEI